MNNGDKSAMPFSVAISSTGEILVSDDYDDGSGLTKREYFAAMAMQGLLAWQRVTLDKSIPEKAVEFADSMLKALERPVEQSGES